ncbi:MAG: 3-deoxy-D-manno-octulosonic acid transferase, partial [Candidatus Omnitrophica bacterium]|nr:3-deoxy-D-manno-octulosonic acid transferase [Candidatus Omnitrophota bacterium]
KKKSPIWLHAVSVGETQAARPLVEYLKLKYPDSTLVISTVTATANKIAKNLISPNELVIYSPLDISFVVKKTLDLINPKLLIIAETEIWPNLIVNAASRNVPIVMVNGRISSGSFRNYKLFPCFLRPILLKINLFAMQTKTDAQRIIELGAEENKVKVTGNMKFDILGSEFVVRSSELGLKENEKLFIAGSTHRGEEQVILRAYQDLVKTHPDLKLLIAPRHIERVAEIEKLITRFGFRAQRVSAIFTTNYELPSFAKASEGRRTTNSILILDTIGQLRNLYQLADIVFIGGSLISHGGQNPIEPAYFSKAILFGPDMSNFSSVSETLLKQKAAILVRDAVQLKESCLSLLTDSEMARDLGQRAKQIIEQNRGATFKNLELINQYL